MLVRRSRALSLVGALAVAGLVLVGCSDSDGADTTIAPTTALPTSTSPTGVAPETTASAPPTTPPTTAAPTPTSAPIPTTVPGSSCVEGSSRDCIDPLGDGGFVYLIGGGDCIAAVPDPAICADLDGDGYAGYPDAG